MANPANLTVTELVANAASPQPAGDTIDTDGTVPILAADLKGATDRLILEVTNDDVADGLIVTVLHGDNPPAVRESLGDLTTTIASGDTVSIGPLESARFIQADGTLQVAFESDGGANASATVRAALLPKAV